MDWIKVKAEHITPEYSNAQIGALIRFQLFIARYGRYPTDKEIQKDIGKKDFSKLKETLRKLEGNLKEVQRKVEEDRELINSKRDYEKNKKRKQRAREKCPSGQVETVPIADKIREEKRREDNKNKEKKVFKPPTQKEVLEYSITRGREDLHKKFFDYYHVGDWKDRNGVKVKNWKQKFITWENNNEKPEIKNKGHKLS